MPSISFVLKATGALLMLHAAYSCMHYRSILQDLDLLEIRAGTPSDVYAEVAVSFFLVLLGELIAMGPLQSVEVLTTTSGGTEKKQPLVAHPHKTRDFDVYSNRSKLLLRRAAR